MANKCSFLKASEAKALARDASRIWSEICAIQKAILASIDSGQYDTVVAGTSPMTWVTGIADVTVVDGGGNYFPIIATATISHPTGVNASVTPVITNGAITGFTVSNGGSGYAPVPAAIDMTGEGNGDAILVPIVVSGSVSSIVISDPGTGYTTGDPIGFVHPTGAGAVATVGNVGGSGQILSITITNNGQNYGTIYATVAVSHPTGVNFAGVVQVTGGVVTGVSIQNNGVNYYPLYPTATVSDISGTGAVLSIGASDISGGEIESISVTSGGFGYSPSPTITINAAPTSSGSGAIATATITADPNNYGTTSPNYYSVLNGQLTDRVIYDQIDFVKNYFTSLGYVIRPQVNPMTGNTMQWYLEW